MKVYAVRIGKRLSGDDEMIYLWRKKKLAIEYTIFLHAGKVVTMELTEIKSPSGTKEE